MQKLEEIILVTVFFFVDEINGVSLTEIYFIKYKKMKPLQSMQNALTWFCVYPVLDANAKWKKWASVVFSLVCVGTITFQVWASVAFVRMSDNFKDALDSFRVVLGWTPLVIEFIIVIVIKNDIVALFDGLSVIYETSKFSQFH